MDFHTSLPFTKILRNVINILRKEYGRSLRQSKSAVLIEDPPIAAFKRQRKLDNIAHW